MGQVVFRVSGLVHVGLVPRTALGLGGDGGLGAYFCEGAWLSRG